MFYDLDPELYESFTVPLPPKKFDDGPSRQTEIDSNAREPDDESSDNFATIDQFFSTCRERPAWHVAIEYEWERQPTAVPLDAEEIEGSLAAMDQSLSMTAEEVPDDLSKVNSSI